MARPSCRTRWPAWHGCRPGRRRRRPRVRACRRRGQRAGAAAGGEGGGCADCRAEPGDAKSCEHESLPLTERAEPFARADGASPAKKERAMKAAAFVLVLLVSPL